jgi:hypothetical protein
VHACEHLVRSWYPEAPADLDPVAEWDVSIPVRHLRALINCATRLDRHELLTELESIAVERSEYAIDRQDPNRYNDPNPTVNMVRRFIDSPEFKLTNPEHGEDGKLIGADVNMPDGETVFVAAERGEPF